MNSENDGADVVWEAYLGAPGLQHPTYSVSIKPSSYFVLKPRTATYVSFSKAHYSSLETKGFLDEKKYCSQNDDVQGSLNCYKQCFIDNLQVKGK